ncbi:hemerythrin domain-containing protein [Streptomyces sp. H39-S7]|uniref:hemerythrin domain-containing protein n=1 Tax=Streptomyces sp. H39-S7 TaxID=3004357 RepID=UPI0022AF7276|nr:hemerythrin domain-containing protein [Streptomyces sp. H39-S7]MCZ4124957.1 hemerythrin domain-containing protein [Streptomyces sp. H39-S7]
MCEYCGCQSVAVIDDLTREHELVVNLIGEVRAAQRSVDVPRMARVARRIAAILEPHTEVEEQGLFPALADEFPEQIAALTVEHRRIAAVLHEAAQDDPVDAGWPARLVEVAELLRNHILKEQDGVFPAALVGLDAEQWDTIGAIRARVGTLLPDPSP